VISYRNLEGLGCLQYYHCTEFLELEAR